MDHYSIRMIEEEAEDILSVLKEIEGKKNRADFMLLDSSWIASIPANILNIPAGSLWNFLVSNNNRTVITLPEDYPLRKVLYKYGGDKLVKLFEKSRIPLIIRKYSFLYGAFRITLFA